MQEGGGVLEYYGTFQNQKGKHVTDNLLQHVLQYTNIDIWIYLVTKFVINTLLFEEHIYNINIVSTGYLNIAEQIY